MEHAEGKSKTSLEDALQKAGEAAAKWAQGQNHHARIVEIKLELKPQPTPNPGIVHEYVVVLGPTTG